MEKMVKQNMVAQPKVKIKHFMIQKRVYLEGGHEKVFERIKADGDISDADLAFFQFPTEDEISEVGLSFTHWSYFEAWDSYRNYVVALWFSGKR